MLSPVSVIAKLYSLLLISCFSSEKVRVTLFNCLLEKANLPTKACPWKVVYAIAMTELPAIDR